LEQVQDILAWDDVKIASELGITVEDFFEQRQNLGDLPASSMLNLSAVLGTDPESLAYGRIDRKRLRASASLARSQHLPSRYTTGAFSRRRTSLHLLKFSDAHFGTRATYSLLKKLEVRREIFDSPDEFINLQFLVDACEHLKSIGLPEEQFFKIGTHSAAVNKNSPLAHQLRKEKSVKDAFDLQVNHLVDFYDLNYQYWIEKLTATTCIFACVARPGIQEAMKTLLPGSKLTCLTRIGVSSAITALLDLPFAPVQKVSCLHQGDSACRYFVDLEPAQRFQDKVQGKFQDKLNNKSFRLFQV
jgi:hypothetical protein